MGEIVEAQRRFFSSGATIDISFRREQLKALSGMVMRNKPAILKALKDDLGKPPYEAYLAEIAQVTSGVDHAVRRLDRWARPARVHTPLYLFPASSHIRPQPYGVSLIIAPWNYPMALVLEPLIGAVAAGNCAVLKPSEITPATADLVASMIAETYDPAFITTVTGGAPETEALLDEEFDYIFYTGGTAVGKIIMRRASEHLTPLTLELGGKSPCIVEPDADLEITARRIAWGKFFNAGQTCIAPDYLLVNEAVKVRLLEAIGAQVRHFYGEDPSASPDYARIVSDRHFERVTGLMTEGEIVLGGQTDAAQRYIAPTIIDRVEPRHRVMQEEIFGPVLPVIGYGELGDAIDFVNGMPRPLSLYFFSRDAAKRERIMRETTSGGACINDTMLHYSNPGLPFGGVGASGIGRYHGKFSFDAFSNQRAVVERSFLLDIYLRYPPYRNARKLVSRLLRYVT
jgi:aldehyde dehydrogenase (NAD+)